MSVGKPVTQKTLIELFGTWAPSVDGNGVEDDKIEIGHHGKGVYIAVGDGNRELPHIKTMEQYLRLRKSLGFKMSGSAIIVAK